MPYPNEHAARLKSPGEFVRIKRQNDKFGKGIHAIWGVKKTSGGEETELQAIRFDRDKFTVSEAKAWLKAHDYTPILFEPAGDSKSASSIHETYGIVGIETEFTFSEAGEYERNGQPARQFVKDMISVGQYEHPIHHWKLNVTRKRLEQWAAAFRTMRDNGVDIEVVVDHRQDAEAVVGYVLDMYVEGDTLYGVHELVGADAIALAQRVKNVSVWIEPDCQDGKGVSYGEAIVHSSIVQRPVVPGQGQFTPIAASAGSARCGPLFILSSVSEEVVMDELLKGIRKLIGAGDDCNEKNALSMLSEHIEKISKDKGAAEAKLSTLEAELAEAKKASQIDGKAKELDPDVADQLAETTIDRIDALVASCNITKDVGDKLKKLLAGEPGHRPALMLSRSVTGTDQSISRQLLSILKGNNPVELGEKSKAQTLVLSRTTPDAPMGDVDNDLQKEMVDEANGA